MKQLSVHLIMKLDKNKQNSDNYYDYQPEISWLQKFCVTILLKEKLSHRNKLNVSFN